MQHISGISRQQIQISSLEDKITSENPVRFIEAFVENISPQALGFQLLAAEHDLNLSYKSFCQPFSYGYIVKF